MRQIGSTLVPDGTAGCVATAARPRVERYDRVRGRLADAVLAYLPLAVGVFDRDLRLLYWNAQAAVLWGMPPLMAAERPNLAQAAEGITALSPGQRAQLISFCADHVALGDRVEPDSRLRMSPGRNRRLTVQIRGMGRGGWMMTIHDSQADGMAEPPRDVSGSNAWLDALTGLANRRQFNQALQTLPPDAAHAVLLIDINGLQAINGGLGRAAGDALLCVVARRLAHEVREGDLPARLGGDAFAILVPHRDAAPALASRLGHSLCQPFLIEGQAVEVGFAAGLAAWRESADQLMEDAMRALQAAQGGTDQRWSLCDASQDGYVDGSMPSERQPAV
jgi:diguanylate cyclase (GGDEF)-like protein